MSDKPYKYYMLPISFQSILERKPIAKCDLETSIAQKLHLTLITFLGENRFNRQYGCAIWENDFENIYNLNAWKDKTIKCITESLKENEKRLSNIKVSVEIKQEEITSESIIKTKMLRKRLDVFVTGNLLETNKPFYFGEPVYVSPVSLD